MKSTLIGLTLVTGFAFAAQADEEKTLKDRFDVASAPKVILSVPVGSVDIRSHDDDSIKLQVVVTSKDDGWFSSSDLEDVSLSKAISGDTVELAVEAEDTKQEWRLTIPADADLEIEMGVGQLEIDSVNGDIIAELGVGDVEVELENKDYSAIELGAGVGDVDLNGFRNIERERRMVSEEIEWQGDGKHNINIEVGVGDIDVSH